MGSLNITVTATDQDGNEVTTEFEIKPSAPNTTSGENDEGNLFLLEKNKSKYVAETNSAERVGFRDQLIQSQLFPRNYNQQQISRAMQLLREAG